MFWMCSLLLFILHFLPRSQIFNDSQLEVESVLRICWAAFAIFSFTCFHFYFTVFVPLSLFLFACLFLCFTLPFTIRYMSVPLVVCVYVSLCVCVCVQLVVLVCRVAFFEDETFCRIEFELKGKSSRREKIYKDDLLFSSS